MGVKALLWVVDTALAVAAGALTYYLLQRFAAEHLARWVVVAISAAVGVAVFFLGRAIIRALCEPSYAEVDILDIVFDVLFFWR